jgi:hypothetical protein
MKKRHENLENEEDSKADRTRKLLSNYESFIKNTIYV